jgi:hypothetical protein
VTDSGPYHVRVASVTTGRRVMGARFVVSCPRWHPGPDHDESMIVETPQLISCFISTKSEILSDHPWVVRVSCASRGAGGVIGPVSGLGITAG